MTGYFPPPPARPAVWKILLTVVVAVMGPPAAAVTAFFAAVTWSGCFIGCTSSGDHLAGGLLWGLAIALLMTGPVLAATLLRSWIWVAATIVLPVLAVAAFAGLG